MHNCKTRKNPKTTFFSVFPSFQPHITRTWAFYSSALFWLLRYLILPCCGYLTLPHLRTDTLPTDYPVFRTDHTLRCRPNKNQTSESVSLTFSCPGHRSHHTLHTAHCTDTAHPSHLAVWDKTSPVHSHTPRSTSTSPSDTLYPSGASALFRDSRLGSHAPPRDRPLFSLVRVCLVACNAVAKLISAVSSEDEDNYTAIIDGILATADLTTITRKKIRLGLEKALGGKDLTAQKDAIKALIEERFDAISGSNDAAPDSYSASPAPKREANGHDDDIDGEIEVSVAPVRKRQKREDSSEDADAKLAAKLQAQENQMARGRTTRGGNGASSKGSKAAKKKKAPRKKSDKKIDDSDVEDSGEAPKRKAGGGFQKPFNLSEPLSELLGEPQLSRPQVVKKLWEHIKGNDLQDPENKRQIICDDKMHAIFKQSKVDMFQMNKMIGAHLYPVEEQ
ncbi:DEK C terminal domain-containing protein [Colletotrichum tamarilloi]|uniref:DEK C terminal domain-containing protein n=1 Tax=Colletotrichum tamarilloi TaxID=1209934 RepID=A0ABQ9QS74_9PEZI|nr:DEK C terminal domain-containing protein [Colletotrichum tamarilloi]KAK1483504.1 DEK C terminal domain-containing protein [Colletotrichum tamarilloi]